MNRTETEDGSYASARNRKLLAEWAAKAGENEYAEPALNPCQTTAYAFFTGDSLGIKAKSGEHGQDGEWRSILFLSNLCVEEAIELRAKLLRLRLSCHACGRV